MIKVEYRGGVRFTASTRGHEVTTDLTAAKGGTDQGMTPPELLVSAFGTCVGVYVTEYLQQVGIDPEGTTVDLIFETKEDPRRIGQLHATVNVPAGVPEKRKPAVQRVAEKCLVHETLRVQPEVTIEVA